MSILGYLLAILGLSVLVIVHEAGHYLLARAFGMRVLRFSVGFGPTIAKFQPQGSPTVFQVGLVPFLAYVQIAGMNPAEENDPNDPELYPNKSVTARFLTIFAGPFFNYMLASILVLGLALTGHHHGGGPPHEPMVIETVQPNSPAAQAGLVPGDIIVQANGQKVRHVEDLIKITGPRVKQPTTYIVQRAGKELPPFTIVPVDNRGRGIIGIVPKVLPLPLGQALAYAVVFPFELTVDQLRGLAHMAKQGSTEGLMGPVGMVKTVAGHTENVVQGVNWLILLSVALGFFNLIPLPALDGGRLAFLGYEIITRRRANERFENVVHTVGLVLLLCLIALVTLRDVAG